MYADNLLNMTQNFLTPDIVNRFSSAIGESTEKTQKGLKSVIPSLLMGIVNKGQTSDGAENLVKLVGKDGFEGEKVADYNDENYLSMGNDAVKNIFGGDVDKVASNLGQTTGIQSSGIKKMMYLAAPLLMGVLGKKMKREGLSTSGLMGFLNQEKSALSHLVPEGLVGRLTAAPASAGYKGHEPIPQFQPGQELHLKDVTPRSPWMIIGLIALAILAFVWWFTGSRSVTDVSTDSNPIIRSETDVGPTPLSTASPTVQSVSAISGFLNSEASDLPRVFRFENLNFQTNEALLMDGSAGELDQIAAAMKEFPAVIARIEGHTDNTGSEPRNLSLSTDRAKMVKDQLVQRGVEAGRLQVAGVGSSSPVDTNNTEAGRAANRRIEFIILSK